VQTPAVHWSSVEQKSRSSQAPVSFTADDTQASVNSSQLPSEQLDDRPEQSTATPGEQPVATLQISSPLQ